MSAWTKDKPTEGGWWWYRHCQGHLLPSRATIVFLSHVVHDGPLFVTAGISMLCGINIENLPGEWAPMPGPPK